MTTSSAPKLIAVDEAARLVRRRDVVMVGGFGFAGKPVTLVLCDTSQYVLLP